MAELPKPEELAKALTTFPPKLSVLFKPLTMPEDVIESTIKSAGIELPPGPSKMLMSFIEGIESSLPTTAPFTLPGFPTPTPTPTEFKETPKEEKPRVFKEF